MGASEVDLSFLPAAREGVFHPPFAGLPTVPAGDLSLDRWMPDVLGPGFVARRFRVPVGTGQATLVRHVPGDDPHAIPGTPSSPTFMALYLHGWNDYFFQRELARHISAAGGAFAAVDLHAYGRSLREGDTPGWCRDLSDFGADITYALRLLRAEVGQMPLVLIGHSTGGLVAALWMLHNADQVAGVWLTSPWLELQVGAGRRRLLHPLFGTLALVRPRQALPLGSDTLYSESMGGWRDGEVPRELAAWRDDPSVSGFDLVPTWKNAEGNPILAGWISAITAGHTQIAAAIPTDVPLLLHASRADTPTDTGRWEPASLWTDAVLTTDVLVAAASRLSTHADVRRYYCRHDPILSFPQVRQQIWGDVHAWLPEVVDAVGARELGEAGVYAICP